MLNQKGAASGTLSRCLWGCGGATTALSPWPRAAATSLDVCGEGFVLVLGWFFFK